MTSSRLFIFWLTVMTILIAGTASVVESAPAYPGLITYSQPDGTLIEIYLKGDERINWAETPDGYTLLVTRQGEYQYAMHDESGDLVFSGIAVSPHGERSDSEKDFLTSIRPGLRYSEAQKEMLLSVWQMKGEAITRSFPTTGERRLICILMETPDKPFVKLKSDFEALFNQFNYVEDGASGSVRDYYLENSYQQFDLVVDVVGPFTATQNMSHYGSTWEGARELATEAVNMAAPHINFADYDNDEDGWVDGVYMIFAGYGEEAGGGSNTIWSHAWSIDPVQYNNVWINRYACSPELRGNSGANLTHIGVIAHEFGHILGAPDFYDTGGNGFTGTGGWDMMAGGVWNNSGATPAHHNPYTKTHVFNWAGQIVLEEPQSVLMFNSVDYHNHFYRINTTTPGEYYILENRMKTGFDAYISGEGLLIYHVHSGIDDVGNNINADHPQRMYVISAGAMSDPDENPASYGNINSEETPFPGSTSNSSFTDISTPSSISWAGAYTNKPITNIAHYDFNGTVTFDFMNEEFMTEFLHWDNGVNHSSIGLEDEGKFQTAIRFEPSDIDFSTAYQITEVHVFVAQPATSARIIIWQGEDQLSLEEMVVRNFQQPENQWARVMLAQPHVIDPSKELWIGVEYDDPGEGVFPAGIDNQNENDGKGNLFRNNLESHDNWLRLTSLDISGTWNIRALIEKTDQPTDITENPDSYTSNMLELYPNPASDQIHVMVKRNLNANARISVLDISGKVLFSERLPVFHTSGSVLSIDHLSPGVYMVRVDDKAGSYVKRFIRK